MLNGNDLAILHSVGEYTETFRTKGMGYKLQQGARAWVLCQILGGCYTKVIQAAVLRFKIILCQN